MEEAAEQLRGRAQLSKFMARTYKGDMYLGCGVLFMPNMSFRKER